MRIALSYALLGVTALQPAIGAEEAAAIPPFNSRIDAAVSAVLSRTGLPSASIALVHDTKIIYAQAYGLAQLSPQRPATPAMRYAVGSISKEFTACALLLLQESGQLSIDDPAGKWGYALGLDVELKSGKRILRHGGEVGGFTAENRIYPDDGIAIVVLTNQDATDASSTIADALADLLLRAESPPQAVDLGGARDLFKQLQSGKIDRQRLTDNANSYFNSQALEDYRTSLNPLGEPASFILKRSAQRGGFETQVYEAVFAHQTLDIIVRSTADGRIEQYTVSSR